MSKLIQTVAPGVAALMCAVPLLAHHSDRMIDSSKTVWLKGVVLSYEPINPHALIELEVTNENGRPESWTVEGPRLARLAGLGLEGDIVHVGDVIEICGFYPIAEALILKSNPHFIHGKILVTPDGQKWAWGPYGRLRNCVGEDEWDSIASGTNPLRP